MKTKRIRQISSIAAVFLCFPAFGLRPEIKNYSKNLYDSGAQNWDIAQSRTGVMYFANSNGILQFNSIKWETCLLRNRTSVRSVLFDEQNSRLYAAGTGEIGYLDYSIQGKGKYVRVLDSQENNIGEIWDLSFCGGKLYFRDNNNVYSYDDSLITRCALDSGKVEYCTVLGDRVYAASSTGGVYTLVQDGKKAVKLPDCKILEGKRICGLYTYGEFLLAVTSEGRIYSYRESDREIYEIETELPIGNCDIFCSAMKGNTLALGTITRGILLLDLETGRYENIDMESGMQNNSVLSLHFDLEKNLWAGLDKGIDYINLHAPSEELYGPGNGIGCGYAAEIYDGKLYLGTNQGLFVTGIPYRKNSGAYRKTSRVGNITGQVWSLRVVDGKLFCCHDLGVYIIEGGKVRQHIPLSGTWNLIPLSSHPDILLGCSYDRLFTLKKRGGSWVYCGALKGFDRSSKEFVEDIDGRIWFAHWIQGLYRLSLNEKADSVERVEYFGTEQGFPTNRNNMPQKIGSQFIFSTEGGYVRYDETERQAHYIDYLNGKFSRTPIVTGITELPDGTRYYSSGVMQAVEYENGDGITVLDSLSLKKYASNRPIGFYDLCYLEKGRFIINTEDGFAVVSTERLGDRGSSTGVFIESVSGISHNKLMVLRTDCGKPADLKLPSGDNSLTINYVWPVYSDSDDIRYSYILENYDKEWSPESRQEFKEYTKLPHGKYVFKVRARNIVNGKTEEDSIEVHIAAPWYLSWPAYLVYLLLFGLLIWLVYIIIMRISDRKARVLAQRKEEELRQKHLKAELEHKAEDLAVSTMNLIRKNEILQQIDSDVQKAADYVGSDNNRTGALLAKIRKDIHENIAHDDDWQKFEKNFDVVYEDFLKRLGEKFPSLTVADKKMCAYLKMDLSSKDMAPLLNMTVRSVEMTRYRLRKKLELGRSESLTAFLQKF